MNTVKQAATHREAGLEVVMGIQYLSQLGAKAESAAVTEAIRKGVTNLLQSLFLFRLGDPEDAQAATRVAMSVFQTMIRSDIDSRELMGVTPEQSLYLPYITAWRRGSPAAPGLPLLRADLPLREAPRRRMGKAPSTAPGGAVRTIPRGAAKDLPPLRPLSSRRDNGTTRAPANH